MLYVDDFALLASTRAQLLALMQLPQTWCENNRLPSQPPPITQSPSPPRSLVRDGQLSPHWPRLVVSRSTCPPLSPSPHANSFIKGTAVINTHTASSLKSVSYEKCKVIVFHQTPTLRRQRAGLPWTTLVRSATFLSKSSRKSTPSTTSVPLWTAESPSTSSAHSSYCVSGVKTTTPGSLVVRDFGS